ncbi:hypothetical protein OTSUT76_4158, partial [Orientia tsutsugamushi str. UT76]
MWGFNTKVLGGDANESNKGQSSNQQ